MHLNSNKLSDVSRNKLREVAFKEFNFTNQPLPMQSVVGLNAPPNTPVFTLQAKDPDPDSDIHYVLVRDRTGGRFEVDEYSGLYEYNKPWTS